MLKNLRFEFNENEINAEELSQLLEDNIIPGYFRDGYGNSIDSNAITIGETYELGDIEDGMLEDALDNLSNNYTDAVIKVSGEGDDAGSLWRFEAECSKGSVNIKKSDYYKMVIIGDYDISDYQGFVNYGNGKGMSEEDFVKYKKEGIRILL